MSGPATLERRTAWVADGIRALRKRGALVQVSGGIDSTVVLHLCARALGPEHVTGLFLPDDATDPLTRRFAEAAAESAGCRLVERNIAPSIAAQADGDVVGDIIRRHVPEYDATTHAYAVNTSPARARRLGAFVYEVVIGPRHGKAERTVRVSPDELRRIIAHQNRKQRTRMLFAYAEAEAENLAVVGASNGDELDTGFVVKYGDDAADLCAIGDLRKTEVYELARELGVPREIVERPPTTDTYALEQTQQDYYFPVPADVLRVLATTPGDQLSDAVLAQLLSRSPGWSASGLQQAAGGLRASLTYQRTRSLRPPAAVTDRQEETP